MQVANHDTILLKQTQVLRAHVPDTDVPRRVGRAK